MPQWSASTLPWSTQRLRWVLQRLAWLSPPMRVPRLLLVPLVSTTGSPIRHVLRTRLPISWPLLRWTSLALLVPLFAGLRLRLWMWELAPQPSAQSLRVWLSPWLFWLVLVLALPLMLWSLLTRGSSQRLKRKKQSWVLSPKGPASQAGSPTARSALMSCDESVKIKEGIPYLFKNWHLFNDRCNSC